MPTRQIGTCEVVGNGNEWATATCENDCDIFVATGRGAWEKAKHWAIAHAGCSKTDSKKSEIGA